MKEKFADNKEVIRNYNSIKDKKYNARSRSTRREPLTMGKQLVNFITCGCESNALFFVIYKAGREPTQYWR